MELTILGVVKLAPVAIAVPPVDAAYQLMVPVLADAPNVIDPLPQFEFGITAVIVGIAFIVAATKVLDKVVHPTAIAST